MVDIEIHTWFSLFLNLETNQILYSVLVSWKVYKIQPIIVAYQKPGNLKFYSPFRINIQKREGHFNFEKPVFDFSVLYPKKSGLNKKFKVSTLNIRIKQSGLKVSHSKVPSSVPSIIHYFLLIQPWRDVSLLFIIKSWENCLQLLLGKNFLYIFLLFLVFTEKI